MGCSESMQAGAVPPWGGHRWTCSCPSSLHHQRRLFHLPLPVPCHPTLTHQGCTEHRAAPLHLPWGRGWGGGGLAAPSDVRELVGMSWGWQGLCPPLCAGLGAAGLCLPVPCCGGGSGTGQESCTLGTERPGRDTESDAPSVAPTGASTCPGKQEQARKPAGSAHRGSSAAPWLPSPRGRSRSRARRLTGSLQPLSGLTGSSLSPSPFA